MEQILQDKDLTMSEKGLMCYLLNNRVKSIKKSKLDGFFGLDGKKKISRVFDSLCKKGYIETAQHNIRFVFRIYNNKQTAFKTISEIKLENRERKINGNHKTKK